jgi:hypothetical protein
MKPMISPTQSELACHYTMNVSIVLFKIKYKTNKNIKKIILKTNKLGIDKMKKKKYHTVRTVPKSNRTIVEIGKIDTPNTCTQIHDCSLSWYNNNIILQRSNCHIYPRK